MQTKSSGILSIMLLFTFFISLMTYSPVFPSDLESNINTTKNYVDTKNNFEINYPSNWEIAPRNSTFPYYGESTEVVFRPIGEPLSPLNQIIFSVAVSDINMSLTSGNLNSSGFLDRLVSEKINSFEDPASIYAGLSVKLIGNNYTDIGGNPSREVVFLTQNLGTFDMDIYTIKGGYLYHFIFMSPQSKASEIIPQIQQMKDSFTFT